ncbi:hypothetical protein CTAYLR_005514 [Chrysophaeum taylorii]|uniref:Uncharacterized protein n=1 Tax=Chrysophaeum taylorii TaxID=2483200 RepID=A0AAD7XHC2_9STRA|nr:hypothetical protein CTAYLR_005514 [Chrysophaeum taylorii]
MVLLLHDKLMVGSAYYEPARRRVPRKFSTQLESRFFEDASMSSHRRSTRRKLLARENSEVRVAEITRALHREMLEVRRLQDALAQAQGQHLEAETTLVGATMLQCAWRGRDARVKLKTLVEVRAIGLIGKYILRYLNKKRQKNAACVFQSHARVWKARRDAFARIVARNAATVVQTKWRVYSGSKVARHLRTLALAAREVVTNVMTFAKARLFQRLVLPSVAATSIQRRWRRLERRRRALELRMRQQRAANVAMRLMPSDRRHAKDAGSSIGGALAQRTALQALTAVRRASRVKPNTPPKPKVCGLVHSLVLHHTNADEKIVDDDDSVQRRIKKKKKKKEKRWSMPEPSPGKTTAPPPAVFEPPPPRSPSLDGSDGASADADYESSSSSSSSHPAFKVATFFDDLDRAELENLDFVRETRLEQSRLALRPGPPDRPPSERARHLQILRRSLATPAPAQPAPSEAPVPLHPAVRAAASEEDDGSDDDDDDFFEADEE